MFLFSMLCHQKVWVLMSQWLRILEIINSFYPQHAKHDLKILVNDDANESMTEHLRELAYNHGPPWPTVQGF